MQIKLFTIPVMGGEALNEDLNKFLRSKKILQVEQQLQDGPGGGAWCFCVKYIEDFSPFSKGREKTYYKKVLDKPAFQRFSAMREVRKRIAKEEGIPAYAVFTDAELADLAKIEDLTPGKIKGVKGIGEKKLEKYGFHFANSPEDEKS
ncbi:MAG: HRDC domain-containing protein [Phaeodactylibacter sp.]|nr:HRDC domain-containing protein [Phaeodactylibacter sp.]